MGGFKSQLDLGPLCGLGQTTYHGESDKGLPNLGVP